MTTLAGMKIEFKNILKRGFLGRYNGILSLVFSILIKVILSNTLAIFQMELYVCMRSWLGLKAELICLQTYSETRNSLICCHAELENLLPIRRYCFTCFWGDATWHMRNNHWNTAKNFKQIHLILCQIYHVLLAWKIERE